METVDELMTPGCPQCAIKHLSAALAMRVAFPDLTDPKRPDGREGTREAIAVAWMARALINLVEAVEGYPSHRDYAVGLLVEAEQALMGAERPQVAHSVRGARLGVSLSPIGSRAYAAGIRLLDTFIPPRAMLDAHLFEATREMPSLDMTGLQDVDGILRALRDLRKEYFDFDGATAAPEGKAEKGGECDMTKKTMKKAAAKATKAALKAAPAKAKKAACKGGKTCKSCKK